jgi:hypothetical protein
MSRQLRTGDRVHMSQWGRQKGYHTGEKGTVLRTLNLHDGGPPYYPVAMEKDIPAGSRILVNTNEIEADV